MKRRIKLHFHRVRSEIGPGTRTFAILKRVALGAWEDGFIHAGNLAYMAILSLFPFFIVAAGVFSLLGDAADRTAAINAILLAVPRVVAEVVEPVARDVVSSRTGWLLWAGALFGLWTVGSLIETIRDILHRAYGTKPSSSFLRYRMLSVAVIIGSIILLMMSLSAQIYITAAQEAIAAWFPDAADKATTLSLSRILPAFGLMLSLWLLFLTLTPRKYRDSRYPKWPGALFVTGWWMLVTMVLPIVLRTLFAYDLTYGSLAGVMIALFFFWLVGLGLVVGAELNAALATEPAVGDEHNRESDGETATAGQE
ncbi:YihY/virulence factor BrkB family protein [Croceicoccus bisphenolivorans]|uniref:YihY/virulence factor BrkB family protein n=1 Tax=Croceicoccus bisphenolivorans TaxID=1783232 RepID=UPI00082D1BF3|nr:YihY/virulence factor BrkB family protein [Croceicoccus bisphenolivorans]